MSLTDHERSLLRDLDAVGDPEDWFLPSNHVDEEGLNALVAKGLAERSGSLRAKAWAVYRITPAGRAEAHR